MGPPLPPCERPSAADRDHADFVLAPIRARAYARSSSRSVRTWQWSGRMAASAAVASHSLHGDGRGGNNRRPEESVLCGVVQAELETFLARAQARERPVPRFVERELRGFLRCGILAAIQPPDVTEAILDCVDLPSRAPPTPAAFPDPDGADGWPGDFEATLSARAARAARWTRDDGQGRSDVGCGALRTAPAGPRNGPT
jgi:hypothetical protein